MLPQGVERDSHHILRRLAMILSHTLARHRLKLSLGRPRFDHERVDTRPAQLAPDGWRPAVHDQLPGLEAGVSEQPLDEIGGFCERPALGGNARAPAQPFEQVDRVPLGRSEIHLVEQLPEPVRVVERADQRELEAIVVDHVLGDPLDVLGGDLVKFR